MRKKAMWLVLLVFLVLGGMLFYERREAMMWMRSHRYVLMAPGYAHTHVTLEERIAPPVSTQRVPVPRNSFGAWLRRLPVLPRNSPVLLYTGQPKARQDVHEAVVDLDVGPYDLQQCADAVMRLRSEYLFAVDRKRDILFHPDPGKPRRLQFTGENRRELTAYLVQVFTEAGSASLQAEMSPVVDDIRPGDVLIQGGRPGHVVLVLDVAEDNQSHRFLLLGQSYMPAQQFHVLKNKAHPGVSPWYAEADLDQAGGLTTPEWRPFFRADVRRFAEHTTN